MSIMRVMAALMPLMSEADVGENLAAEVKQIFDYITDSNALFIELEQSNARIEQQLAAIADHLTKTSLYRDLPETASHGPEQPGSIEPGEPSGTNG